MNSNQISNEHHIKKQTLVRKLLMDRSQPGKVGAHTPESDVPKQQTLPNKYLREELPLPEVSENTQSPASLVPQDRYESATLFESHRCVSVRSPESHQVSCLL